MKKAVGLMSIFVFLLSLIFGFFSPVYAQQLDSDQVKIAYIFNFSKHISWPADSSDQFIIAVYDDPQFQLKVKNALEQRRINNKPIHVVASNNLQSAKGAHLVFIPSHQNINLSSIANDLRLSNTLLVSDQSDNKHDIMINLIFNRDNSAISFEVNKSNIVYEQLTMSTELLLLGGTELDVATLYRETERAMQSTRQRELELNAKIAAQQKQIDASATKLESLNVELQRNSVEVTKKNRALVLLERNIATQRDAILEKEEQLSLASDLLERTEKELMSQQDSIVLKEIENQEMAKRIEDNRVILEEQQKSLAAQGLELELRNEELSVQLEEINNQRITIFVISVLIVIAVIVSVLVVILFFKNRKTTQKLVQTLENLENTQGQLIQSEKMASLGTLTAGVAHEINTPLGIIVTSISLLKERTDEVKGQFSQGTLRKSAMSKFFDAIEKSSDMSTKALERVLTLLGNFKQVAADQVVEEAREINLADYIEEVMSTLSAEIKKSKAQYSYSGETKLSIVTIPGILAQILTNFVTNSLRHAFENKQNGHIQIHVAVMADRGAKIIFQDNGCGMSADVIEKIYDPFFTTKRSQGGTGLGMNIVYNLINKKLEGNIQIESVVGEGTTVTVTLPAKVTMPTAKIA